MTQTAYQSVKLSSLALFATLCLLPSAPAGARDLTVAGWGGSSQEAQRKVYLEPFSKASGIKVLEDTWSGGMGILRTKARGGNPDWDVVLVEADEMILGCEEGLYEKLDWSKIGPKTDFLPEALNDCGVGSHLWSTALNYDGNHIKDGPKSWADFWDLQKFPGKRAMRRGPKYTLEVALMADGVPPKEVYKVLRTSAGVDRAFKKLDAIKSNIVWWTSGAQPPQLLISGEVAMAVGYTSRVAFNNVNEKKNLKVVWDGSIYAIDFATIMKGSPNKDNAAKLLNFWTRPENQAKIPPLAFQGVTNVAAIKIATDANPDIVALMPTYLPNLQVAVPLDVQFWVDNTDQLTQRFNAWVSAN